MRGSRGGWGGPEFAKLNIADITGNEKNEKIVIFYICALPQLYVNQNQSYLRLDPPPWKKFLDPHLIITKTTNRCT